MNISIKYENVNYILYKFTKGHMTGIKKTGYPYIWVTCPLDIVSVGCKTIR